MILNVLAKSSVAEQPWFILILILVFFGLIVLGVILFKKFVLNKNKKNDQEEIDEAKIREEHLKRILEPVTDEESLKAMEDLEKENDNK